MTKAAETRMRVMILWNMLMKVNFVAGLSPRQNLAIPAKAGSRFASFNDP
jgi:hypothetical protein